MKKLRIILIALLAIAACCAAMLLGCESEAEQEHVHNYEITRQEISCTEGGYILYSCACGDSYREKLGDAYGHDFSVLVEAKDPTCTEKGNRRGMACSRCKIMKDSVLIRPALGHEIAEETMREEPTCTEDGKTYKTCKRKNCSEKFDVKILPKKGHTPKTVTINPTCTQDGKKYSICSVCKQWIADIEKYEKLGHEFGKNSTILPIYTTDNVLNKDNHTVRCNRKPNGEDWHWFDEAHTFEKDYDKNEQGHYYKCTKCGGETKAVEHELVWESTESEHKKVCKVCGFISEQREHSLNEDGICECGYLPLSLRLKYEFIDNESGPYAIWNGIDDITRVTSDSGDDVTLAVPNEVNYEGKNYPVKEVNLKFETIKKLEELKVTRIELGKNVNKIKAGSFSGYENLKEIWLPNQSEDKIAIEGDAFKGCNSLESVHLYDNNPELDDWVSIEFGNEFSNPLYPIRAHDNEKVATLYLNDKVAELSFDNVNSFNAYAFAGLSASESTDLNITVNSIGTGAFKGYANLENLTINFKGENAKIEDNAFEGAGLTTITVKGAGTIVNGAFKGSQLVNATLLGVTEIGADVFADCTNLKSVDIKNYYSQNGENYEIQTIGGGILQGCTSLESVTLPFVGKTGGSTNQEALFGYLFTDVNPNQPKVAAVDQYYNSSQWNTYYIPKSIKNVTVNGGTIKFGAFSMCTMIKNAVVGDGVTGIEQWAFLAGSEGNFLETLTIGKGVKNIGIGAFKDNKKLSVINYYAEDCTVAANKNENGAKIDVKVFDNCGNKANGTTINFYSGKIPDYLFKGCNANITAINFNADESNKNKPISIGKYAFANCINLSEVEIVANVTSLGVGAFERCDNLNTINFNATDCGDVTNDVDFTKNKGAFSLCGNKDGITVNIGSNVTRIPARLFEGNTFIKDLKFNYYYDSNGKKTGSLVKIADYAFNGCFGSDNKCAAKFIVRVYHSNGKILGTNSFDNCSHLYLILEDSSNLSEPKTNNFGDKAANIGGILVHLDTYDSSKKNILSSTDAPKYYKFKVHLYKTKNDCEKENVNGYYWCDDNGIYTYTYTSTPKSGGKFSNNIQITPPKTPT